MKKRSSAVYYLAVAAILVFYLGPILWCLVISLTPEHSLLKAGAPLIPQELSFANYQELFNPGTNAHRVAFTGLVGSIKIAALTLVLGVPMAVGTGYVLATREFFGKKLFVHLILLTIVIPVFTTIIPIYNLFRQLDLLDSMFWTAVIYISSVLPLNIWIAMNYFKQLPRELWQAAAIDGFTQSQTFFKVILPISAPVVLTNTLIILLMAWKQYVVPVILLASVHNKTITMVLSEFMTRDSMQYGMISAVGIIAIIPPALAAIVFRKFLLSNLSAGTLK